MPKQAIETLQQRSTSLAFIWLLMVSSGFVMIEPAPFELLGALLIITSFAFGMRIPKGIGLALIFWGIFLFFNILSAVLSPEPSFAIKPLGIRTFLIAMWLFISCLIYENPKRFLPILMNGYSFGAIFVVIIGCLAYFSMLPNSDNYLRFGRVKSTFKDPNVYGPYLVPVIMYYLSKLESGNNGNPIINVVVLGTMMLGLLLGFSRGSWLNLALAMLTYLSIRLLTLKETRELSRITIIGSLAIVIGTFFIAWLVSTSAIGTLFQERAHAVQGYDIDERFATQLKAINAILTRPLGIGTGMADYEFGILPHNVYLYLFSECGWFAGLAYLAFVALTIKKGLAFCLRRTEVQLLALVIFSCLLATQLQSFFIDSHHWRHLYILYGLMWGTMLHYETYPNEA